MSACSSVVIGNNNWNLQNNGGLDCGFAVEYAVSYREDDCRCN
ncbi:hypothetical protein [Bacillus mycoides]